MGYTGFGGFKVCERGSAASRTRMDPWVGAAETCWEALRSVQVQSCGRVGGNSVANERRRVDLGGGVRPHGGFLVHDLCLSFDATPATSLHLDDHRAHVTLPETLAEEPPKRRTIAERVRDTNSPDVILRESSDGAPTIVIFFGSASEESRAD